MEDFFPQKKNIQNKSSKKTRFWSRKGRPSLGWNALEVWKPQQKSRRDRNTTGGNTWQTETLVVYSATWMVDFYGKLIGWYTSTMDP